MENDNLRLDTTHAGTLPACATNQIRTQSVTDNALPQAANDSVSTGTIWQSVPSLTQAFHPGIPNRVIG